VGAPYPIVPASGKTSFGKLPPIRGNFLPAFQRRPIRGNWGKYPQFSVVANISSVVWFASIGVNTSTIK
jgi:hypothetical protein